jgi:hypothetical protein
MIRLKSREDAMIKTRKTKVPPIVMIYLAVVVAFGALVTTRIHAPENGAPVEARLTVPARAPSFTL